MSARTKAKRRASRRRFVERRRDGGGAAVTPSCPLCHASPCPETRLACWERGEVRRALWQRDHGFEPRVYIVPPSPLARAELCRAVMGDRP